MSKKEYVIHLRNCRGITTLTGPETYLLDLISGFQDSNIELLLVFSIDPKNPSQLFVDELIKRKIKYNVIKVKNKFFLNEFFFIYKLIKKLNVKLLNTHDFRSDLIGILISKLFKVPIICFAHGWVNWTNKFSKDRLYAYLESLLVSFADAVIVASKHMYLDSLKRGISNKKIVYIPIGIDIKKFNKNQSNIVRKEFNIPSTIPLIGNISRIHPWKGQKYFLEAAKFVSSKIPDAKFMIVGDIAYPGHKRYKQELINFANHLNIMDNIIFTGSRKDIPQIMLAFDIFVLPSIIEPFGLVVLEAQACMKPVVASRVGGIPETMKDGETGILVNPKNSGELANAILYLLKDENKRLLFGKAGRNRIESLFTSDIMIAKTNDLYQSIMFPKNNY